MRPLARLCTVAASALFLGGIIAPQAGATEASFDAETVLDQLRSSLTELGISTPEVNPQLVDAATTVVNAAPELVRDNVTAAAQNLVATADDLANQAGAAQEYLTDPAANGPNYSWSANPIDQILAGKLPLPDQGAVLHRVPGSYFDAPRVPQDSIAAEARGVSLYGAGTPIYIGTDSMCTLSAVGTDASGRKVGITAGHCGTVGEAVLSADSWGIGASGTIVETNAAKDYAIIEFGSNAELTNNYNGVVVSGLGNYTAHTGATLCKDGVASGHSCGPVLTGGEQIIVSQVCAMPGDSGAPVTADGRVVGIVNGGSLPSAQLACQSPLQGMLFMPTVMTPMDTILADLNTGDQSRPGAGFRIL